jgi:S1-C subfamily serine protease
MENIKWKMKNVQTFPVGKSMHPQFRTIFLALIIPTTIFAQNPARQSPREIAREQSRAVVVVESLDERGSILGQGSGFIVTPGGAVISNLHVIRGASIVRVKLPNGDMYKTVDVVDLDENKDIVILKVKGFQLPVVRLGDSDQTEVGETIVAISSPEGLTNSISTGVISGVRKLDTHRVFQITAPISNGSSGGALFDSAGSVIGIVTYLYAGGQNINFAVPINYARGMISDRVTKDLSKVTPKPAPDQPGQPGSPPAVDRGTGEQIDGQLTNATRGRLGRTQQEPMFVRPDEAIIFFYRLVEGIGLTSMNDTFELTRTAAASKTKESDNSEEYTIKYLSFYSGLTMGFSKPERILTSVELLVNWSEEELKNSFGDNFRKRKVGNRKILDYGKLQSGKYLVAELDGNGNVRSVRFSKEK